MGGQLHAWELQVCSVHRWPGTEPLAAMRKALESVGLWGGGIRDAFIGLVLEEVRQVHSRFQRASLQGTCAQEGQLGRGRTSEEAGGGVHIWEHLAGVY